MDIKCFDVIGTVINFIILFSIMFGIYKAIKWVISFDNRNKEMEKKIDVILSKLENKEED